jgi:hypothetical protein
VTVTGVSDSHIHIPNAEKEMNTRTHKQPKTTKGLYVKCSQGTAQIMSLSNELSSIGYDPVNNEAEGGIYREVHLPLSSYYT